MKPSIAFILRGTVMIFLHTTVVAEEWHFDVHSLGETPPQRTPAWSFVDEEKRGFLRGSEGANLPESKGLEVSFPHIGNYWIWVEYRSGGGDARSSFYTLLRDGDGEGIALGSFDWLPVLPSEYPWRAPEESRTATEVGWRWEALPVTLERVMEGTIHFGPLIQKGPGAPRQIRRVIVSDHRGFSPSGAANKLPDEKLNSQQGEALPTERASLIASRGFPLDVGFFAGIADPAKQFKFGMAYIGKVYRDEAQLIQLGFNRTQFIPQSAPLQYGVRQMRAMDFFDRMSPEEAAAYPFPEGRFVNAAGEVGKSWSLSFAPLREGIEARTAEVINREKDDPSVEAWRIIAEKGGFLDYSEPAIRAFRDWLKTEYPSIANLNELWITNYASFDEVEAPRDSTHKASWFAFRQFSGRVFAEIVKRQSDAIAKLDPDRLRLQQLANLDLLAPRFTTMRPMDWEEFIEIALEGNPYVSWDSYSADDFMGAEIDLVRSIAGGRTLLNKEWNTHAADPRIPARTLWSMIGKGLKGVHAFIWQEGAGDDSYPKWALLNPDFTPKRKLGAMVDIVQETHRLERLLMAATPADTVKPIALYYSRLDLSLGKPLASAWGEGIDTPYHVYAALRGMGYPVRWITPRQIEKGELQEVGAVVLIDTQYIPGRAAAKLHDWVREGGAIIGDRFPGAFDEFGRPQTLLSDVFGVKAEGETQKATSQLALQESTQGYGEVTFNAIGGSDLPDTVAEIWQQWDSDHPILAEIGPFTLSGYGQTKVRCVAGRVIGMTFGGRPGIVVNNYGKGYALYTSLMLGSLYESSATRYEWDSTHSGAAFPKLLDAFLRYAGVAPSYETEHALRTRLKLRLELPLVDPKGNVIYALSSQNDEPMKSLKLALKHPSGGATPKAVLIATGGSRHLQAVPFSMEKGILNLELPGFDTHAAILALTDSDPLVSLRISGAERGAAGLLLVQPGTRLTVEATVFNPSAKSLPEGNVALWAPKGWYYDAEEKPCPAIPPWGKQTVTFTVEPPEIGGPGRLRPLVVKHRHGVNMSTPATEQVWWNLPY